MEKSELLSYISEGLSQREMSLKTGKSHTSVRYWLNKYKLKTKKITKINQSNRRCCKCGETDINKFYGKKSKICGKCHNEYTIEEGRKKRNYVITQLGGKCCLCDFDDYPCSLDVHHLNPSIKDKNFSSLRGWSYRRIDKEIKNCVLLCKNCHTSIHSGYICLITDGV